MSEEIKDETNEELNETEVRKLRPAERLRDELLQVVNCYMREFPDDVGAIEAMGALEIVKADMILDNVYEE
jgi:hypothetical protein